MDITSMTTVELKALAYDQMKLLELTQNNLRVLAEEIRKREEQIIPVTNGEKNET